MSWEIMRESKEKAVCACGKGFVTRIVYEEGDDWNRYREGVKDIKIECDECATKYHLEDNYLVPNGKTLRIKTHPENLPFEHFITFEPRAVALYPIDKLQVAVEDMRNSKFSTRLTLDISRKLVEMYFRDKRSKKLANVIDTLAFCIANYDSFEWNYDKIKEYRKQETTIIQQNRKAQKQVLSESYELRYE